MKRQTVPKQKKKTKRCIFKQSAQYFGLKTRWYAICPCPKRGNKIEGVVLNRVCILELSLAKQGQGFKLSVAHLYPNIG